MSFELPARLPKSAASPGFLPGSPGRPDPGGGTPGSSGPRGLWSGTDRGSDRLDTAIGPVPTPAPFDDSSPYAQRTAAILEMANAEALEAGSPVVRSRDILFGILRKRTQQRALWLRPCSRAEPPMELRAALG